MGVIYKLREDVVSFIIARKGDDPSVSVRQLAALTSEKFKTIVSKSSVNTVLKKASLSSSVGRRTGSALRPEKFSIPPVKKQEISKSIHATGFVQEQSSPTQKVSDVQPATEKKEIQQLKRDEKKRIPVLKDQKKESLLDVKKEDHEPAAEEIVREVKPLQEAPHPRHRKKDQGIPVSSGMGFVFLKAAQWKISNRSLMGELFAKHMHAPVSKRFDAARDRKSVV